MFQLLGVVLNLLGTKIEEKFSIESHVESLYKKASQKLNALDDLFF